MGRFILMLLVLLCTCDTEVMGVVTRARHGHYFTHPSLPRAPINARTDTPIDVKPFEVTISYNYGNDTEAKSAPGGQSPAYAYLVGQRPGPPPPPGIAPSNVFFLGQKSASDPTDTVYYPSDAELASPKILSTQDQLKLAWTVQEPTGVHFNTPGTVTSGRIWIGMTALDFFCKTGQLGCQPDPNTVNDAAAQAPLAFLELTHSQSATSPELMIVNLSFEDWISLPVGMNVTYADSNGVQSTTSVPGLRPGAMDSICDYLRQQGSFWPELCTVVNGKLTHVTSPPIHASLNGSSEVHTYWDDYIDMVWNMYKDKDLVFDGQMELLNSTMATCRVRADDHLHCDQGAGVFPRPDSVDVWGCSSGPFAAQNGTTTTARKQVVSRLCAAIHRSTLHYDAVQPSPKVGPSTYYNYATTNHYAKAVHDNLLDGKGYAFSYDDVAPDTETNTAGVVSTSHPIRLDIYINA